MANISVIETSRSGMQRVIVNAEGMYIVQYSGGYCWRRYGTYKTKRGALAAFARMGW